jgi:phenolic acid decarboxylase
MITLFRGSPIILAWNEDITGGFETEIIDVSNTVVHSLFYQIPAGKTISITIAKGFEKDGVQYFTDWEDLEPDKISSFQGDDKFHLIGLSLPYCQFIKFNLQGTATFARVVFMQGAQ